MDDGDMLNVIQPTAKGKLVKSNINTCSQDMRRSKDTVELKWKPVQITHGSFTTIFLAK